MYLLHVLDQVASFCVRLGTPLLLAREGFDGCMLLQMDTVSVRPHERFSAELTLVRPLSGVQTSMLDQMALLLKALVATGVRTHKWSFTFMDSEM